MMPHHETATVSDLDLFCPVRLPSLLSCCLLLSCCDSQQACCRWSSAMQPAGFIFVVIMSYFAVNKQSCTHTWPEETKASQQHAAATASHLDRLFLDLFCLISFPGLLPRCMLRLPCGLLSPELSCPASFQGSYGSSMTLLSRLVIADSIFNKSCIHIFLSLIWGQTTPLPS